VLSAVGRVRRWLGSGLEVVSAEATLRAPEMDAAMRVELDYDGVRARCLWDMDAEDRTMTWTVTGLARHRNVRGFGRERRARRRALSTGRALARAGAAHV
jgi:hypothetical protein